MSFSDKLKDVFLDRNINKMCAALRRTGIDAQLAEGDRYEKEIDSVFLGTSRGIIDISEGPIRWVNVVYNPLGNWDLGKETYIIKCGVPDPKIGHDFPNVRIKSVRKKCFPLFGSAVGLHWEGDDFGLGIISRLTSDISLKRPLMESHDVTISAYFSHEFHTISGPERREISTWVISTEMIEIPSERLWSCYQRIAQHLLGVEHKQLKEIPEISEIAEIAEEEVDEMLLHKHNECPECGSSNINKAIKRMARTKKEIEAKGFRAVWDCLCLNCRYEWVEREK